MIVDLKPQDYVVVQPDAAALLHHDHRSGLHPSSVAARSLTCFERRLKAKGDMPSRGFERLHHLCHDAFPGKDVALRRAIPPLLVACPGRGLGTRVRCDFTFRVDDGKLASLLGPICRTGIGVGIQYPLEDSLRWHALLQ